MRYIIALLLLASCGYRFGRGELIDNYCSICIPYVEGDQKGDFTTALIHTMTTRGALAYRQHCADTCLQVCLFKPDDNNIGFAYAPEPNEDHVVVSNEARVTLTAKVTLIDRCTGMSIWGPINLSSSIDFDYEPDLGNVDFHAFSLGQLEMHNLAREGALPAVYGLLAQKIVDYVNNTW